MDGYGFKIRKVSRCKPTDFLYKIRPRTKYDWYCTIGILINTTLVNIYFILCSHLFLKYICIYIFEWLCFSEYAIWMFLFVFWLRNRPSIRYLRDWENGRNGSHLRCVQVCKGERSITSTRMSLFSSIMITVILSYY